MKIYFNGERIYTKRRKLSLMERWGITRFKVWGYVVAPALIIALGSTTINYAFDGKVYAVETVFIPKTVEVEKARKLPKILQVIADCESGEGGKPGTGRQFNADGSLVQGRTTPADWGKFQINTKVWSEKAKELGYDLRTEEGNTAMALFIFETRGTRDWSASAKCWAKRT